MRHEPAFRRGDFSARQVTIAEWSVPASVPARHGRPSLSSGPARVASANPLLRASESVFRPATNRVSEGGLGTKSPTRCKSMSWMFAWRSGYGRWGTLHDSARGCSAIEAGSIIVAKATIFIYQQPSAAGTASEPQGISRAAQGNRACGMASDGLKPGIDICQRVAVTVRLDHPRAQRGRRRWTWI
jgi:hypothetical protein